MERVQSLDFPDGTYFFEQTTYRKRPRRQRKRPEDLPKDLRFAHLNPRVAAYLANKEKEKAEQELLETVQHHKTLLPEIKDTVHLIRHQLDSALSNDEDAQRWLYNQFKAQAGGILVQLARVLYLFSGIRVNIPRSLEQQLLYGYKELTADVSVVPRDWQCLASRDEYFQKLLTNEKESNKFLAGGLTPAISISNMSTDSKTGKSSQDDDTRSIKSDKTSRVRPRPMSRQSGLADIAESDGENELGRRSSSKLHTEVPTIVAPTQRESSRANGIGAAGFQQRPKTRLEKFRTGMYLDPNSAERASSTLSMRRARQHIDDMESVSEGSKSPEKPPEKSVDKIIERPTERTYMDSKAGYYTIIQFQLSSKACEDKGWIIHQSPSADRERETLYEWATQRLQVAIKQRKEQEKNDAEIGHDKPVVVRYYGDSKREVMQKYGLHAQRPLTRSAPQLKEKLSRMEIPATDMNDEGKKLFMTTVADGSTIVYYPSGRPAIVTSSCGVGRVGYYTFAYDDTPDQGMLAAFTPSGKGCCYYDNGVIRFLAMERSGTLADKNGAITKRFDFPMNGTRLPTSIILQLNSMVTFRFVNQQKTHLYFNSRKETAKIDVSAAVGAQTDGQVHGNLLSGLTFTSKAAKEHLKSEKVKLDKPDKKSKGKRPKDKGFNAEVKINDTKLILDLPPEPTENDPEADRILYKLQRKIKNTVEDWLEHYRIAVGIASPHLKSVSGSPARRQRPINSAKSSPGGCRVIIESLATSIVAPSVEPRVPSAPPGRTKEDIVEPDRFRPKSGPPAEGTVFSEYRETADEDDYDEEDENFSATRPFHSSGVRAQTAGPFHSFRKKYAGTAQSMQRSKSAPHRLAPAATQVNVDVTNIPFGACPIALRGILLGEDVTTCKCNRHKIPYITDIEYEELIQRQVPDKQLLIIAVVSSLFPESTLCMKMIERMHSDRNRNRTRPCLQSRSDAFRILKYDIASAAEDSNHNQPLLLRRHNVIAGMFLMYQGGKLVFCDHIFNGYGNARKDFQKQLMLTRRSASLGYHLPKDFRFSPQRGRHGPRAAWGGEIGGAGVDRYASTGLSLDIHPSKESLNSLSSSESGDAPIEYHLSRNVGSAANYISMSLSSGYKVRPLSTSGSTDNISGTGLVGGSDSNWNVPRVSKYSPSENQYSTSSSLKRNDPLPTIHAPSSLLSVPNREASWA